MPHKHIEVSQTGFQGVPHDHAEHLTIHKLYEDNHTDKSHYLMTWLGEIEVGKPIHGHFQYGPTVMYVVEGNFHVEDKSKPGEISKLTAGDVIHLDHGCECVWTSPDRGRAFAVCYAPSDVHPEDIVVRI